MTTTGVEDWRSRLTLIPQDAILFNGTIRENLDPFGEYDDAALYDALRRIHLHALDTVDRSTPTAHPQPSRLAGGSGAGLGGGLSKLAPALVPDAPDGTGIKNIVFTQDTKVSEGGNNFSHGQRQLISMARALLRKSNLIVMDEPTASAPLQVDFETDAKIQATIREEFNQSILLTIAHRLRTIIDNDRILVLSAGRVVEFDTPLNLLAKPDGVFHDMCRKSGDYDELLRMVNEDARWLNLKSLQYTA
ncbi:hypothetical protein FRC10_008486 [Ceratobasidium sp. 414]|nr:hypothetical protein FRC10_008486 [Ceratobasidium sp. 414]